MVCVKPAGVLSTDEPGGVPELVRAALGEPHGCVRTVHRLDAPVAGLMVFARLIHRHYPRRLYRHHDPLILIHDIHAAPLPYLFLLCLTYSLHVPITSSALRYHKRTRKVK